MLAKNTLFTIAYFLSAVIGGFAAVSPNGSSPVWPAAGVGLAAIYLYGNSVLPGIFLGTLFAQIYSFQDFSNSEKILDSLIIGSIIAIGSSAQAVFGSWLLNKNQVSSLDPLLDDGKILRFILFGALASTIIAPTVGTTTLLVKSVITPENYLLTWGTWWVGDSVGVLIFTPIILIFFAQPRYFWQQRTHTVAFPLLIVITVTLILFVFSKNQNRAQINERFNHQVTGLHNALITNFQNSVTDNQILKAFFDNSSSVDKSEFYNFTEALFYRHPYMQALEWIPRIEHSFRKQFEQNVSGQFRIMDTDADNSLIPAKHRREYYPILYAYPKDRNRSVLGFDVTNNKNANQLIEKIKSSDKTLISTPIRLVQDRLNKDINLSYVFYSPVYNKNSPLQIRGIIASVLRVKDMIDTILPKDQGNPIYLNIRDDDIEIFRNHPALLPHGIINYHLSLTLPIDVANKHLLVTYLPGIDFINAQQSWTVWFILLGGFLITGLSGIGLMMLTGRTLKTEELIKQRTSELNKAKKDLEQQNKALIEALSKAKQGVQAKDSFLASMSHELRTPLTAVLGFAQLLEMEDEYSLSSEQKVWVGYILSSGQHLLKLIDDVLDFAKLSSGKQTVSMNLVELSGLVNECLQLTEPLINRSNITLERNNLTQCFIRADETKIKQVLLNLLSNAIKYNRPNGHISVALLIMKNNKIRLVIEDSGLGIPKHKQGEVFQAFNRMGREATHSEGTGIGLVISKNLVERMSGKIGFDSQEDVGSKFWIEFDREH